MGTGTSKCSDTKAFQAKCLQSVLLFISATKHLPVVWFVVSQVSLFGIVFFASWGVCVLHWLSSISLRRWSMLNAHEMYLRKSWRQSHRLMSMLLVMHKRHQEKYLSICGICLKLLKIKCYLTSKLIILFPHMRYDFHKWLVDHACCWHLLFR